MKDKQAALVLSNAVRNSLGALSSSATNLMPTLTVNIPGVPARLAPAVTYVLAHASDEAKWAGIDEIAIADKIDKQIGLEARAKAGVAT